VARSFFMVNHLLSMAWAFSSLRAMALYGGRWTGGRGGRLVEGWRRRILWLLLTSAGAPAVPKGSGLWEEDNERVESVRRIIRVELEA